MTGVTDTLGTELLESLLKMAPSKEEERKLKEHKDDSPTKLGPAEKFLKAVLDVPFAFKRVEAMLYIANFESEVEYLRKSFQTLEVVINHHSFPLIYLFPVPLFLSISLCPFSHIYSLMMEAKQNPVTMSIHGSQEVSLCTCHEFYCLCICRLPVKSCETVECS